MTALSAVLTVGMRDFGWLERHPLRSVAKPPAAPDRERVLTIEELHRLFESCKHSRNLLLYPAVVVLVSKPRHDLLYASASLRWLAFLRWKNLQCLKKQ
jgi:hypothetical protein